ncbi:hypothetical protein ABET22_08945 [Paenibacillus chibensis]
MQGVLRHGYVRPAQENARGLFDTFPLNEIIKLLAHDSFKNPMKMIGRKARHRCKNLQAQFGVQV